MVAFRKWFPVLAIMGLTLGSAMTANAQALSCNANAGVPPILRAEGITELVGDIVLDCTGGNPAAPFLTNIQIFLNTNVTSRIVGSNNLSEALLMINEPGATRLDPVTGLPLPVQTPAVGVNMFQGSKSAQGQNSLVWLGVPITPPGTNHLTLRITNVRANASMLGTSSSLIPTQVVMFISASGSTSLAINQPQQAVGFIQPGLLFDVRSCSGGSLDPLSFNQCISQNRTLFTGTLTDPNAAQFSLRFREGFATAFKPQFATVGSTTNNPGSTSTTTPYAVSVPGVVYNSETGFTNLGLFGNAVGVANTGTRVSARFNNVPAGTRLFVSTNQAPGSTSGTGAQLVTTDASGAGGGFGTSTGVATNLSCSGGPNQPAAEVTIVNGTGLAVWEVFASNPAVQETLIFTVGVAFAQNASQNLPALGQSTVQGNFAPFYPTSNTSANQMSDTFPIPRFLDSPINANDFMINACQTNLLFPFVTNQAGFDTGIAISNTSKDPFPIVSSQGNRAQGGTCTLNYYGTTTGGGAAPSAQTTSAAVDAGNQLLFVLSSGGNLGVAGTPGFQGYIIAQCKFLYAHGFAFITDGPIGQARVAEGYLALVMDAGIGTRTSAFSEVLAH
jgi:hypothetical protein